MWSLSVSTLLSTLVLLLSNYCSPAAALGRSADTSSGHVTMNYSFLPKNEPGRGCFAKQSVWATSTFSFDPLEKGRSLMLNESTRDLQLRISCVASEPLRWVLNIQSNMMEKISSHYLRHAEGNGTKHYHTCIVFKTLDTLAGSLRCQGFVNNTVAAEIFIDNEALGPGFMNCPSSESHVFLPSQSADDGTKNVIPCSVVGGTPWERSSLRLFTSQEGESKFLNSTARCWDCACKEQVCASATSNSDPTILNQRHRFTSTFCAGSVSSRSLAGKLPEALKPALLRSNYCNENPNVTCSHLCLRKTKECSGKVAHEWSKCYFEIASELVNGTEYDHRIGFHLLESSIDDKSTYTCRGNEKIGCAHYVPLRVENEVAANITYMTDSFNETTGLRLLSGLACSVPEPEYEKVTFKKTPCHSIPSCVKRRVAGLSYPYRSKKSAVPSEPISAKFPSSEKIGRVIDHPVSDGLVSCYGTFRRTKYVQLFDYFFIGIDSKPYLLSAGVPPSAIIKIRQHEVAPEHKRVYAYSFECIISTFVLLRTVEVTLEFKTGKTEIIHLHAPPNTDAVTRNELYNVDGVNKTSITQSRVFINVSTVDLLIVKCSSPYSYKLGWVNESITIDHSKDPVSILVPVITTAAIIVIIASSITIFAIIQYKKSKKIIRRLTPEEVDQFHNGVAGCESVPAVKNDGLNVDALAFPHNFRIPSANLKIHLTEVLGEGEYGRCHRGELDGEPVAVKVLKSNVDVEYFKNFLREVKLLAYIGRHENIVKFHGAAVDRITENICQVVAELCRHGDLQRFLRMQSSLKQESQLKLSQLLSFCDQIASGMEYLSQKKVIHGDLAARNVLVSDNYTLKITDFGLSRKLYDTANYTKKNRMVRLPWRWMSLESLKYLEFSTQSDVWSYGVTVWEIFSFGQVPFAGFNWTADFIELVEQGMRLGKPANSTQQVYEYLKYCWHEVPEHRPSFTEVKVFFAGLLTSE